MAKAQHTSPHDNFPISCIWVIPKSKHQHHFPGTMKITRIDSINIHPGRYMLAQIVGTIPAYLVGSGIVLRVNECADMFAKHIVY